MTGPSMTERLDSPECREVRAHPEGWVCSHALGAVLRKREIALECLSLSPAEVWTISLSQYTLAKGERLLEYICRAKVVNSLPYTEQERVYVDKLLLEKFGEEREEIQNVPFYIDPIHSAASTIGRLGGLAKSEAKSTSSRANGRKGGRPKSTDKESVRNVAK